MTGRAYWRLTDIKTAIEDIRSLLAGKQFSILDTDRTIRAAFERYLEIISEASRHVPDGWKNDHLQIPWRQIADLGNHVRHAYHRIDLELLWTVYELELDPLESAVDNLIGRAKSEEPNSE